MVKKPKLSQKDKETRCPYCHDDIQTCKSCSAKQHRECTSELEGICAACNNTMDKGVSWVQRSKLAKRLGLGILAASLIVVPIKIYSANQELSKISEINRAMNNDNLSLASTLIANYSKTEELNEEDLSILRTRILNLEIKQKKEERENELRTQKHNEKTKLTALLKLGKEVSPLVQSFENSGKYNIQELDEIQEYIESYSEEGLYARCIANSKANDFEVYFRLFPEGSHNPKLAREFTRKKMSEMEREIQKNEKFETVYSQLSQLNDRLEICGEKIQDKNKLFQNIEVMLKKYLESAYVNNKSLNLNNGTKVKFHGSHSHTYYNRDGQEVHVYRDAVFEVGSIGKIIEVRSHHGEILLEFEECSNPKWFENLSSQNQAYKNFLKEKYNKTKKNLALYSQDEISAVRKLSDSEKYQLNAELKRTQELLNSARAEVQPEAQ